MRAVLRAAALAAFVVGASAVPATGAPTLGGRLAPASIVYERDPWLAVTNLSTLPVNVVIDASDGWSVADPTFALEVGERFQTSILTAGTDDSAISATLTPSDVLSGIDYSSLVLSAKVRHERPWEALDVPWWPFLLLLALVPAWAVLRRHRES